MTTEQIKIGYRILQELKTPRLIRRTLTVWIREQKELLQEYKDALARDMNARYYLGEFITTGHVRNAEAELRILESLRADIGGYMKRSHAQTIQLSTELSGYVLYREIQVRDFGSSRRYYEIDPSTGGSWLLSLSTVKWQYRTGGIKRSATNKSLIF